MRKISNKEGKKQKRNTKDEVKNELVRPLQEIEFFENEKLDKRTEKATTLEEAIPASLQKKGILKVAFRLYNFKRLPRKN